MIGRMKKIGKKGARALALASLAITAASSTGSAQPAPPSAAPQMPATSVATATSSVNPPSQPAQSGSPSQRPRLRRVNLSVSPLGPAIGLYSASLAVAMSRHLALRGELSIFNMYDVEIGDNDPNESNFTEYGLGLAIYQRRTFQGPFIEPGVITRQFRHGTTLTGPQLLAGWHWSFSNGLNVAAAIGAVIDLDTEGEDENPINGFFRVGYAL